VIVGVSEYEKLEAFDAHTTVMFVYHTSPFS